MPVAVALGWEFEDWAQAAGLTTPVQPRAVALIGTCDLDQAEVDAIERNDVLHLDARAIDAPGGIDALREGLAERVGLADAWYLHLDLDVAGTDVMPGGLTPALAPPRGDSVLAALRATAGALPVRVATVAVYQPNADPDGRGARFAIEAAVSIANAVR
jgi:arginase